ncbi:hypothetical protein SNEBB_010375 [Seison nebaliae]|nr:hypothetical protein SNEBB_010375 [Seison nebaliae]
MNNLPKSQMVEMNWKTTEMEIDYSPVLLFIRQNYPDQLNSFVTPLEELTAMRLKAIRTNGSYNHYMELIDYLNQLNLLKFRVPIGHESPYHMKVKWKDSLSGKCVEWNGIELEEASILYNIIVTGYEMIRSNTFDFTDLQKTLILFKQMLYASERLKNEFSHLELSDDLQSDYIDLLVHMTKISAHEILIRKLFKDGKSGLLLLRLIKQLINYIDQLLNMLDIINNSSHNVSPWVSPFKGKSGTSWTKTYKFQRAAYDVILTYVMGECSMERKEMGLAVRFFEHCQEELKGMKSVKRNDNNRLAIYDFLMTTINEILTKTKKENDFIYVKKVPETFLEALEIFETFINGPVNGIEMIKSEPLIPSDEKDLFSTIIPMESHTLSSVYSSRIDEINRQVNSDVEEAQEELDNLLRLTLESDGKQIFVDEKEQALLPYDKEYSTKKLINVAAAVVSKSSMINDLVQMSINLNNVFFDTNVAWDDQFKRISDKFNVKDKNDLIKLKNQGDVMQFAKSLFSIKEEIDKNEMVTQSLTESLSKILNNLKILKKPIRTIISSISEKDEMGGNLDNNQNTNELIQEFNNTVQTINIILNRLKELNGNRIIIVTKLKNDLKEDDIARKISGHPEVINDEERRKKFLEDEEKKHDGAREELKNNFDSQRSILKRLADKRTELLMVGRQIDLRTKKGKEFIQELTCAYENVPEVKSQLERTIKFYREKKEEINKLISKYKSVEMKLNGNELSLIENENFVTLPSAPPPSASKDQTFSSGFVPKPSMANKPISMINDDNRPKLKDFFNFNNKAKTSRRKNSPIDGSSTAINHSIMATKQLTKPANNLAAEQFPHAHLGCSYPNNIQISDQHESENPSNQRQLNNYQHQMNRLPIVNFQKNDLQEDNDLQHIPQLLGNQEIIEGIQERYEQLQQLQQQQQGIEQLKQQQIIHHQQQQRQINQQPPQINQQQQPPKFNQQPPQINQQPLQINQQQQPPQINQQQQQRQINQQPPQINQQQQPPQINQQPPQINQQQQPPQINRQRYQQRLQINQQQQPVQVNQQQQPPQINQQQQLLQVNQEQQINYHYQQQQNDQKHYQQQLQLQRQQINQHHPSGGLTEQYRGSTNNYPIGQDVSDKGIQNLQQQFDLMNVKESEKKLNIIPNKISKPPSVNSLATSIVPPSDDINRRDIFNNKFVPPPLNGSQSDSITNDPSQGIPSNIPNKQLFVENYNQQINSGQNFPNNVLPGRSLFAPISSQKPSFLSNSNVQPTEEQSFTNTDMIYRPMNTLNSASDEQYNQQPNLSNMFQPKATARPWENLKNNVPTMPSDDSATFDPYFPKKN